MMTFPSPSLLLSLAATEHPPAPPPTTSTLHLKNWDYLKCYRAVDKEFDPKRYCTFRCAICWLMPLLVILVDHIGRGETSNQNVRFRQAASDHVANSQWIHFWKKYWLQNTAAQLIWQEHLFFYSEQNNLLRPSSTATTQTLSDCRLKLYFGAGAQNTTCE